MWITKCQFKKIFETNHKNSYWISRIESKYLFTNISFLLKKINIIYNNSCNIYSINEINKLISLIKFIVKKLSKFKLNKNT